MRKNLVLGNTRELNEVPSTKLSILYILSYWSMLQYHIRRSSYWGESPQNGLEDKQTCGMTLASAYMLCYLSTMWLQLQIIERSLKWE